DAVAEFDEKALTIAPNPASTFVVISVGESLRNAELTVYDIQGKVCYSCKIQGDRHEISTCDFPAGIYFVKVASDNANIVRKVVIQH
ncbi:MAG: T9SS type A sorting domain-containing protein, partial [Bacteroidales bacterium]|nr:T9SS type A sorting domain-containing protein [Bacteroidales bacterium]